MQTTEILKPYDVDTSSSKGTWHVPVTIKTPYITIRLKDMISGCGVMVSSGVLHLLLYCPQAVPKLKHTFDTVVCPFIKRDGVGAILLTQGQDYQTTATDDKLKELGFELLTQYPNYRHSMEGHYNQRLWIKRL